MNRSQKRKVIKDAGFALVIKRSKALNYVEPFSRFIHQIETDNVLIDNDGNILLDMHDGKIKDRIDRNLEPYRAIINIDTMIEIFEQTCMLVADEALADIQELCEYVRINFLHKLKNDVLLEKSDVIKTKELLETMITVFTLTPINIVNKVKNEVNLIITNHVNESKKFPSNIELRAWIPKFKETL